MTRTATAERSTSADESTSMTSSADSSSENEFSIETSVMPPVYLSTAATLERNEPNAASVASTARADSDALSNDVCEAPDNESSEAANDDEDSADSMVDDDAETSEDDSTEDESEEESSEEGEEESEEESGEESDEESEEETDEESEDESAEGEASGGEETAEGEATAATDIAAPAAAFAPQGGGDEEFESIEVVVAKIPRMHPINAPYVGNPPAQAIQRREEIQKRTGAPPDLHHARVRQAAEQVTQAARDAQRRMIIALGRIGRDSRLSIEDMAAQIMLATSAAVAQINKAINDEKAALERAATERNAGLNANMMVVGEALEAHRNQVTTEVAGYLTSGSDEIRTLRDTAEAQFRGYLSSARTNINQVPTQGKGARIPDPPQPRGTPARKPPPPPEAPKYDVIGKTEEPLTTFINAQASGIKDGYNTEQYYIGRSTPIATGMRARTQRQLVTSAQEKGTQLDSDATRAQFLISLLGLTTPVSEHHKNDESHSETDAERRLRESRTEAENACERAKKTITEKSGLAGEYLDKDMRKDLTNNLWKAGRKAEKSFRKQAHAAEVAQNNNAATLAEAYRTLVKRLDAMLPQGQFHDSRQLLPRLLKERDSAFRLQRQHEQLAQEQSAATIKQMDKSKREQIEGLQKSVADGRRGIHDVFTRTCFDMDFFLAQVTNGANAGRAAVSSAALEYATRTAESINDSVSGTNSRGILQIQNAAVGFLNGNISAVEQMQYARLEAFVDTMKQTGDGAPLVSPMLEARSDFEGRADNLHNAMPERSWTDCGILGGAVAVLGGPVTAAIAVGVYLYETDPSENQVIQNLGNVVFPGPRAIGEVFRRKGYGDLQGRIRDRLDNPEKQQALDLFSRNPRVRGDARRGIAERSTDWFGYNREAREAALSGMSAEEHASMDPGDIESTRALLESELDQNQADISTAFLDHNRERAVAAMTRDALDRGTRSASWGWIFSAEASRRESDRARVDAMSRMDANLRSMLAIENSFAAQMQQDDVIPDPLNPGRNMTLRESRGHVFQEFAFLTDPANRNVCTTRDAARRIDLETARRSVTNYATRDYTATVIGPRTLAGAALMATPLAPLASIGIGAGLAADQENVSMGADARNYIDALVNNDPDSDAVRSARGIFEVRRAEEDGSRLSETDQVTISEAVENRTLARHLRDAEDPRKTPEERSRARRLADEEMVHHRARMRTMAIALGADREISGEAAVAFMANRVGNLYANSGTSGFNFTGMLGLNGGADHSRYGREMITGGRASLDASVALATDGVGTNEALLRRSYADRSPEEIRRANDRWAREHNNENMNEMLGISRRSLNATDAALFALSPAMWFMERAPETSGDLAMELEVLALGNPESDEERLAIADLRQRQERRGTGWLGRLTMDGSTEEANLGSTRGTVNEAIYREAVARDPSLRARFPDFASAVGSDGRMADAIRKAAFDDRGNFRGDRTIFAADVSTMRQSADAYRARLDRIESALTTFITVWAIVASIALMLIPGVNVVAAGIAVALIAGAATIAVKMGMRGERYGWEEMATDIATTAIECATAGISGGIAGGFKAGPFARLASVGKALESGFGRIGGAIVREAVVNAVSSAASTAIQDDTWKDGFSRGLTRVGNGAIRGAVVGAVSTGLSEGISAGMSRRMSAAASQADGAALTRWQQLGQRLGPHGGEMLREAISNGIGGMASEAVGLGIDYAQGNFHGTFGDALKRIGLATLRESVTGAARSGITSMHKEHYRQLLEAAHQNPNLTPSQLHTLRLFGISAGVLNYDTSLTKLQSDITASHNLLGRLPSSLRAHAQQLDFDSLQGLVRMLESGDIAYRTDKTQQQEHLKFLRDLESSAPGLDIRKLMTEIDSAIDSHRTTKEQTAMEPAAQQAVRARLGDQLHEGLKMALDHVPVEGLQHLSDTELQQAAAMVASGKFNREQADALFRAVKSRNPEADEFQFLSHLNKAVEQSAALQKAAADTAQARRQQLVKLVPEEAAPIFAGLSDVDAALAHQLIHSGSEGTPHQQDTLFRAAQEKNPALTRDQFQEFMTKAITDTRTRLDAEASAKRVQREQNMTHVPEELRGTLSALPEAGLVELRLRQMEGSLSPAEKVRLIEMAKKATPNVDVHQLAAAIDQAVAKPPKQRASDAEVAEMRRQLLSGVPAEQRALIGNTPIMVLSDAEFVALTRSTKGQAVTLIIDGKPVVVVREGSNPHALREEGIHAVQAHDPQWAKHIGSLDEQTLADWDKLPLEQQLVLYRNKIALELDAHQRLIASLEADIAGATSVQEKAELRRQLDRAQQAHENLKNRFGEVRTIDGGELANIKAGFSERPAWLDQPARLFSKETMTEAEKKIHHETLLSKLTSDLKSGGEADVDWRQKAIKELDLHSLELLTAIHPNPRTARAILDKAIDSGNVRAFIENAHHLSTHIGFDATVALLGTPHGLRLMNSLANTDGKRLLDRVVIHCNDESEMRRMFVRLGEATDPARLTKQLNEVLSLLKDDQASAFITRVANMEIANAADHIEVFTHVARNINDPAQVQALMHLVSRLGTKEYFDFVFQLGKMTTTLIPLLEQQLPPFYKGKVLSRIVEMAATQNNWKAFISNSKQMLEILHGLSNNPANKAHVEQVLKYLLDPYASAKHLAADLAASVEQLSDPVTRDAVFAAQMARLNSKTARLTSGDSWHARMEAEAIKWSVFQNDPATKAFADFLKAHPSTAGWSDGELGAIANMHKWFAHLAAKQGIDMNDMSPAAVAARNKLMTDILNRGFGPNGAHAITSNGKLTDLNRAFREMVVEHETGIDLRNLTGPHDPKRLAEALKAAKIEEKDFAQYSDKEKEILLQHLYTLQSRHEFYTAMEILEATLGGGAHGIRQNITEAEGEFALASHMVLNEKGFRLAMPFAKGTGFDQVWVGTGPDGRPVYVIGEAKGEGAELGSPGKGPQMSAEWVAKTLREMLTSSNATERQIAQDMIKAIAAEREARDRGENPPHVVRGVVIEAGNSHNKADENTGRDGYDFTYPNLTPPITIEKWIAAFAR